MRTLFNFGIITVIVASFWFGGQSVARQHVGVSVDPFSLTTATTNLPTAPQYDLY